MNIDDISLSGRVAVVSGAGSRAPGIGIGRATAVVLARRGAFVVLVDRDAQNLEETRRMIENEGFESALCIADVGTAEGCALAASKALESRGRIDVLVNNVGIGGPKGDAVSVDLLLWQEALHLNVTSMMLMARHCLPHMKEGASIINIASIAGLGGSFPHLLYPTSKGAVISMSRAMAAQHGRQGIRVNCIAPGLLYTPMVYAGGMSDETRRERMASTLLHTEGTGWDVAYAAAFLASDGARWVTGVVLPIDGGTTAGRPLSPLAGTPAAAASAESTALPDSR